MSPDESVDPAENQRGWATREGEFSPTYYAHIGPNEVSETLAAALDHLAPADPAILELGCSSGRHLAYLRERGYDDLAGVDINDESFGVMADHYPELAETGTFHAAPIEEFVPSVPDDAFDVVYSVETLQHVHPETEWVFEELTRVTSDLLITAENEGNSPERGRSGNDVSCVHDDFPLYHRDWKQVFSELGMAQLLCEPGKRDTVRVFRFP
jgi:SAM-dependent methyltransferase